MIGYKLKVTFTAHRRQQYICFADTKIHHTNKSQEYITKSQIYNKDNLYVDIFMQITSTYMTHSHYSHSSISSLQGNARHSLARRIQSFVQISRGGSKTLIQFLLCPILPLGYWVLGYLCAATAIIYPIIPRSRISHSANSLETRSKIRL